MNNKAILPALIMPIVIGIAIIVGIISFLASPSIRFTLIGIAIMGMTFIFAIPAALSGDFTRGKITFLIFLFFVGLFVIFIPQLGLVQQTTIAGFVPLSISSAQFNDGTNKIVITTVATASGSQGLNIDFKASELNNFLAGQGVTATKGVSGFLQLTTQSKSFRINDLLNSNLVSLSTINKGFNLFCTENDCPAASNQKLAENGVMRTSGLGCACVFESEQGSLGNFLSGFEEKEFEAVLSIGSHPPVTITGSDPSVNFGTDNNILWVGDLSSLEDIGAPNAQVLFRNSHWEKLTSPNAQALSQVISNDYRDCIGAATKPFSIGNINLINIFTSGVNFNQLEACVNTYNNNILVNVLDSSSFYTTEYANAIDSITEDGTDSIRFEGDRLKVNLNKATSFPVFVLTLNANEVGITKFEGKPKITQNSCKNIKFISAHKETIKIEVTNTATNPATFRGSVDCEQEVFAGSDLTSFIANEKKLMEFDVTGVNLNPNEILSEHCAVTITDTENKNNVDTCSFTAEVGYSATILCTTSECNGNDVVSECIDNVPVLTKCEEPNVCKVVDSAPKCVGKSVVGDIGTNLLNPDEKDLECNPFFETKVIRESTDNGFLGWRTWVPGAKPISVTETTCETSKAVLWIGLGVAVLVFTIVLVVIIITTKPKKKLKGKKK